MGSFIGIGAVVACNMVACNMVACNMELASARRWHVIWASMGQHGVGSFTGIGAVVAWYGMAWYAMLCYGMVACNMELQYEG